MQFTPKVIAAALVSAVVVGAGVVGTAHASAGPAAPPAAAVVEKAASADRDGRALFGGLVFTQGKVADSLIAGGYYQSSAETLRQNRSAKAVTAVTKLQEAIEKERPGFFAELSGDLRSGDPRRVQAGLDRTSASLENQIKVVDGGDAGTGACVAAAVAVNIVLVGNVVAVVNAEYAWDVQHFWLEQNPRISSEESIAVLTNLLRTV